jgi:glycosyltransferase involved in cell wall biosynthesis
MNVLFVNNFRSRGGGEEFLGEILPGLADKGVKVGLICRPGTPLEKMFGNTGIEVYPISRSGLRAITSVFTIAGIIRRNRYDLINIQRGHDIIQTWAAALLSARNPRLIYTVHVADFMRSRFLLSRMHCIITISRYLGEKIASMSPALSGAIKIIHHGIDLSRFRADRRGLSTVRDRFGLSPDTPLIGTVGVMWKNQIEFLDALVEIRKAFPDARYALVASDKEVSEIQRFEDRAAELGLSGAVLWVGKLPKEDMPSFYAGLDLAVCTFRNEGFGIWILEALAMGAPVVAFDAGGVRDALEGSPAALLIKNGAAEMASEIIRMLKDRKELKRMSDEGPRWVAGRFSRERMIDEYYRFFDSLAGAVPRGNR